MQRYDELFCVSVIESDQYRKDPAQMMEDLLASPLLAKDGDDGTTESASHSERSDLLRRQACRPFRQIARAGSNYNFSQRSMSLPVSEHVSSLVSVDEERCEDEELDFILPKLNICILVVGTHGDVLPFCALGKELQATGHRVRIASHEVHRRTVTSRELEFYPLAGDPKQLSQWTVLTGGNIAGEIRSGVHDPSVLMEKDQMLKQIIQSTWGAVSGPDPLSPYYEAFGHAALSPFVADAVIANPPVIGHIHVCEALAIPLHIMFPQPWYYGTKYFPHPFSGLSYDISRVGTANYASYTMFEGVLNAGLGRFINSWRANTLNLPRIPTSIMFTNSIVSCKVPFSAMWSPSFFPKPSDWPDQCRVVGTFTEVKDVTKKQNVTVDTEKFADLIAWIESGPKPVFIGFGSMVINDTNNLEEIIKQAAKQIGTRIVVQSSWSKLDVSGEPLCHNVGPVSHDWLLPQCAAVIHHGGAGTTAAGLRYGLPTFVCPFFGDQFMWGEVVRRAGVGPKPCPVNDLTVDILVEKLNTLTNAEMKESAIALAAKMNAEGGVMSALEHFWFSLPRDSMMCSVGLIMGKSLLAKYTTMNGIPISSEVASVFSGKDREAFLRSNAKQHPAVELENDARRIGRYFAMEAVNEQLQPYGPSTYALRNRVGYDHFLSGLFASSLEFWERFFKCIFQIYEVPDKYARAYGIFGALVGIFLIPFYLVWNIYRLLMVSIDRAGVTIARACGKNWLYFVDSSARAHVYHDVASISKSDVVKISNHNLGNIRGARVIADGARSLYKDCRPCFPDDHWNWREVPTAELMRRVKNTAKRKMVLTEREHERLVSRLQWASEVYATVSFNRFCLYVGEAVHLRFPDAPRPSRDVISEAMNVYLN